MTIHIPQRGDQVRLVEMALKNCAQTLSHETDKTGREIAALDELAKTLGMETPPSYIEAYDISNFGLHHQGGRYGRVRERKAPALCL